MKGGVSVNPTTTTVSGFGSSKSIAIICNGAWSVTSKPSWVTVSPSSGTGNNNRIQVTADKNQTGSRRSGNIVFTSGTLTATVQISQSLPDDVLVTIYNNIGVFIKVALSVVKNSTVDYDRSDWTVYDIDQSDSVTIHWNGVDNFPAINPSSGVMINATSGVKIYVYISQIMGTWEQKGEFELNSFGSIFYVY